MINSSARSPRETGYGHWRWQRISALVTLILMLYFTYLLASLGRLDYEGSLNFVATPHQGVALSLLVLAGMFHAALGVQMIIEDYVPFASGRSVMVKIARGIFAISVLVSLVSVGLVAGWI
jgi:succinate dehydrogenase / fumarate reductase membrane anchor subunit